MLLLSGVEGLPPFFSLLDSPSVGSKDHPIRLSFGNRLRLSLAERL